MRIVYKREEVGAVLHVFLLAPIAGAAPRRLGTIKRVTEPFGFWQFEAAPEFVQGVCSWDPAEITPTPVARLFDVKEQLEQHLFVALVGSWDRAFPAPTGAPS